MRQRGYALGARTVGVGLNWYLNESSKFALNYDYTVLQDVTEGTSAGFGLPATAIQGKREHFLVARYQGAF